MRRNPRTHTLIMLGAAGFALALSACGNAAESGMERLVESQSGENVDLDFDGDDGFSMQTEEGGMTMDADGNFIITDADGNVITGGADAESGEFSVESEDGSFSSGATTELPEEWPGDVPEPTGLGIVSATVIGSNDQQSFTVSGSVGGDDFVDSYADALESAGFSEDSTFKSDGATNNVYSNDEWTVGVSYIGDQNENQVNISVFTKN